MYGIICSRGCTPLPSLPPARARPSLRAARVSTPASARLVTRMATLPSGLKLDVTKNCEAWPPAPLPADLASMTTEEYVRQLAHTVWNAFVAEPELFALTEEACQRFMQSTDPSYLTVDFDISAGPPPRRDYDTGEVTRPARARPCPSETADLLAHKDSGVICTIRLRSDVDCPMFLRSTTMHELAHALRRLAFWRSHVLPDSTEMPHPMPTPTVAPFTHDESVRDALLAALKGREPDLWDLMLFNDEAVASETGIHSGYVAEHLLNGGVVVCLLQEPQGLSNTDGSAGAPQALRFALIRTRKVVVEGPSNELMAEWEGRLVLMNDVDIEKVKARPLLRWRAPRNSVRVRGACFAGGSPYARVCPRMTDQQIEEMHSGVPEVRPAGTWQREELPSPTPPPSPPSDRVAELSESARCLKFD